MQQGGLSPPMPLPSILLKKKNISLSSIKITAETLMMRKLMLDSPSYFEIS